MPQTNRRFRFWIIISGVWFLLATMFAVYLAYYAMADAPSYSETVEFDLFLIAFNLPLIVGWGMWWKVPGLIRRVDGFFTRPRIEDVSRERLRRMLADGLYLLNRPVTTELELNRWKTDDENWVSAVCRELKTNFDESLAESFEAVESVQEFDIVSSFNSEHNTRKLFLNKRLNNLIKIIE